MIGQIPKYRILWTWDYCTFWDDSRYVRGIGAGAFNHRRAHFLGDYKRMVDYCAKIGVNGIVIWGALRAYDNGVEQFRELVNYGKQKGVRILPGVGVFAYGGIFYEPWGARSPYSLHSWLTEHPELVSVVPDGSARAAGPYYATACPSKKENMEWFKRSFEWLFSEFQIEGAQIEVGDYAVCYCDECKKRRSKNDGAGFEIEDMAEAYTIAHNIAKKANPDSWVLCETYSSPAEISKPGDIPNTFGSILNREQRETLAAMPSDAIIQWVVDRAIGYRTWQDWHEDVYLPTQNNITRCHSGSQWCADGIDGWSVYAIGDMVKKARSGKINGVSIFGEESPASPPNEANYLVFSEFCGLGNDNPDCDFELFHSQTLDPLYGGPGMSKEWKRIYITGHNMRLDAKVILEAGPLNFHFAQYEIGQPGLLEKAGKMTASEKQREMVKLAKEAHDTASKLSGEACRRWAWLE
ncbi:MAG: hypothetical protein FWD23_11115, partial [Oscillospiraceae bacterium]|nr:hypothetical protein [Oscillospiraceae bacterium]